MFLFEILELALLISQFSLLILELLFAYEPEVVDSQALVVVKADQIFFLSMANSFCDSLSEKALKDNVDGRDIHQPGKYRIIGSVSNSPAFSSSFNCKKTDKMNPDKKCNIWSTKG